MSEVTIGRKKEKCENCTKQVIHILLIYNNVYLTKMHSQWEMFGLWLYKFGLVMNRKASGYKKAFLRFNNLYILTTT